MFKLEEYVHVLKNGTKIKKNCARIEIYVIRIIPYAFYSRIQIDSKLCYLFIITLIFVISK